MTTRFEQVLQEASRAEQQKRHASSMCPDPAELKQLYRYVEHVKRNGGIAERLARIQVRQENIHHLNEHEWMLLEEAALNGGVVRVVRGDRRAVERLSTESLVEYVRGRYVLTDTGKRLMGGVR